MEQQKPDQFIIRTPLLPLANMAGTSAALLEIYKNPLVRNALYIASRDLYKELLNLETGQITEPAKKDKILISLYKYYTRMSTRCTPFGFFSGLNIGEFADKVNIRFSDRIHPHIRIDMDYLCNLYYSVATDQSVLPKLVFTANNTLYKVNNQWRYVEYQFRNNDRYHNLVSVDDNEMLTQLITDTAGPKTIFQLAAAVMEYGFNRQEAMGYIMELIRSQVFVSNLYPSVSGPAYQNRLFMLLGEAEPAKYGDMNDDINNLLASDSDIIEKTTALENKLSALNIPIDPNKLLQVDLLKEARDCTLDARMKKKIEEVTRLLSVLQPAAHNSNPINKFRQAYFERYEQAFMPLMYIMDTDVGLGYKEAIASVNEQDRPEQQLKAWKLQLYSKANKPGSKQIELTEKDIATFKDWPTPALPDSYSFMGSIYQNSDGPITIRYRYVAGPSATTIIGRFGHLHNDIHHLCCNLAAQEENNYSNCILAEIIHLPQGRLGNVVARPQIRPYEIPYLGYSTLPADQQITTDDLYIGVVQNRLVLYSKKHNKEVIPRMANAHAYRFASLPVYHFLCDLQWQQVNNAVFWTWDEFANESFLPRITYKGIILTPALWNIDTTIFKKESSAKDHTVVIEKLRQLGLPDQFLICQSDNELFIDINTPLGIGTFLSFCRKYQHLRVEEFLFTSENAPGGFSNQVVIPFVNKRTPIYEGVKNVSIQHTIRRQFSPASPWAYFKIYTGKMFAERLLMQEIPALVQTLKRKKVIKKWFFIRFADPKNHLRIRFLVQSEDKRVILMQEVDRCFKKLIDEHIIWEMQLATYKREMERYGEATITDCEQWFYQNSELVLSLLKLLKGSDDYNRLLCGIFFMDQISSCFFAGPDAKMNFLKVQSANFGREFGIDKNRQSRDELNDRFRKWHDVLSSILQKTPKENAQLWETVMKLCTKDQAKTRVIVNNIKRKSNSDPTLLNSIAASFIHMFVNRLFPANQRYMEMEMYYFMNKYYTSFMARRKATKIN